MPKKRKRKKHLGARRLTPQQKRFRKASTVCHREADSRSEFGRCMKREMKKR